MVELDLNARGLLRAIRSSHVDRPVPVLSKDTDPPRVAADFAILDKAPRHIGLDVDLDILPAVGTGDDELVEAHATVILATIIVAPTHMA